MNVRTIDELTITDARKALDAGEISARELAQLYIDAIATKNGDIHAYVEVFDDVLEQAKRADEAIARGESKELTGIPLAVKDNILIKGRIASAGSKILESYRASYDACVIERLRKQGAIFLGRANMDEFAMGSSTENSAYGPTKNPHDVSRVPGGSSGGSAAAVAAGLALAALGSDTGGSVRQPAALCGVVGLKPTYGAVSRRGLIAMGSSLDQIGTFGKTVDDARIVFEALRGHDGMDSTSLPDSSIKEHDTISTDAKKNGPMKIGVPRDFLTEGVDADVRERFEETLARLLALGHEIVDITLLNIRYALAAYYIIMPAEASTNLARFDGVRYGLSVQGESVQEVNERSRGEGFGKETKRRILIGTFVLSSGYADAYYRKAIAVRDLIRADFTRAFQDVDVIVTPTTPTPAFKLGEKADPLAMYAADIFTVPVNLSGVPAISIPSGFVSRDGKDLPVGFQIIAPHGGEHMLFDIGRKIEQV